MKKQRRTRGQIYALIEKWSSSGLKQQEFCEKNNIPYYTFKYYRTRMNKEEKSEAGSSGFVPVKIKQLTRLSGLTIIYPNGVSIRLEDQVPSDQLKDLIHIF